MDVARSMVAMLVGDGRTAIVMDTGRAEAEAKTRQKKVVAVGQALLAGKSLLGPPGVVL
jgi:hypothetical protein